MAQGTVQPAVVVRATEDVDLLIEKSTDNFTRVIEGLSGLSDGAAKELTPEDFEEHVVIKIADEVEVDVTTSAWEVTYEEAVKRARRVSFDGVEIPYLSLADLIRSKETYRDQDRVDLERLRRLAGS